MLFYNEHVCTAYYVFLKFFDPSYYVRSDAIVNVYASVSI